MKILQSKIFDEINRCLSVITAKTDILRQNSFLLSNIDFFIFLSIILTLVVPTIAPSEVIGIVSLLVPLLVVIKVFITKGEKIELDCANFFLILYLLICLISNFTSSMFSQSIYGFIKTIVYFAFYFASCQFFKHNKKYIKYILIVLFILIFGESIIAVIQNFLRLENISTWQDTSYLNPEDIISRVYGTLKPYNPNLFAGWLIGVFPSSIGIFLLSMKKIKSKSITDKVMLFISAVGVLLSVLSIFLTGCRGTYISLFVVILLLFAASFQVVFFNTAYENLKKIWLNMIVGTSIMASTFLMLNHGILKRIMSIFIMRGDSSTSFRMNVYSSAVEMFKDNWVQGIGVGNKVFREIYGLYMMSGFDALSCYCVFLEMAIESGIFALLAFLIFLVLLIKNGIISFIKRDDLDHKILLFVSIACVVAVMIHGLVDTIYFRPQVQFVFWTMVAILVTLSREDIEEKQ